MTKQNNTIFWVMGIALFLLIASNLDVIPQFAIVTKTVCIDNKISYYNFDNGLISGKFGKAMEFDGNNSINIPIDANANATTMWVKNYSKGDVNYYLLARINDVNYVNAVQSSERKILPLGSEFGLGFNGSVDDLATFGSLDLETLKNIYNNGTGKTVCYTVTYEEEVTCKDYATSQVPNTGNGCLSYEGTLYPNCTYEWKPTIQYKLEGGVCKKQYYCSDDSMTLSQCQEELEKISGTGPVISEAEDFPEEKTGLNKEMFNIAGHSVSLLHLMVLLIITIGLILYLNKK